MLLNIAHRGASGYEKENTMAAFKKAVSLGADGIETDVQMSRDGVLVLIHDETLERTTRGSGLVKDHTLEELTSLGVPTLEALLVLAKQHKLLLNLELKNVIVPYEGMEEQVIDSLCKHGMTNQVILSSFNHYSMIKCKKIVPHIKTGLLYQELLYKPERYCSYVGADAIHPHFISLTREVVNGAHRAGLLVNAYTINDEKNMKNAMRLGVDMIITNYPDKLKRLVCEA